jgi:hypothetical protein
MDGVAWSAISYLLLASRRFYRAEWKVQDHLGEKQKLIQYKSDRGLPLTITDKDVMPLLNQAVSRSFTIVETNQKAVCNRGWNPSNKLLSHQK